MGNIYVTCARCNKEMTIAEYNCVFCSDIDNQIVCVDCYKKEQPKELMKRIVDLEAKLAKYEKFIKEETECDNFEEFKKHYDKLLFEYNDFFEVMKNKGTCGLCHYIDNEQIKELKRQLAEKEKHMIGQNALLNKSKENNKQLKQQLEKKEYAINNYWQSEKNKKEMFREENKKLKQQLVEKYEFGKFKSAEELLKAYQNLEREFTKSRQKLAESENEVKEYIAVRDDKIKVINRQTEKINELKQKLEESEKELEKCNDEWTEICDDKLETINRLIEEKHELEETIKNKSHNKWLKAEAEKYKNEYQSLKGYVDQLKQQLVEKDEYIKYNVPKLIEANEMISKQLEEKDKEIEKLKDVNICGPAMEMFTNALAKQNQTAIKELEKVKAKVRDVSGAFALCEIEVQIDQQIKSLKGEK